MDDCLFVGEDEVALNRIFEFTEIARPGVSGEGLHESGGDGQGVALVFGRDLAHEMLGEDGNLFDALTQGSRISKLVPSPTSLSALM